MFRLDFGFDRVNDDQLADDYPEQFRLGDLTRLDGSLALPAQAREKPQFETEAQRWHAHLQHGEQSLGWHHQDFHYPTTTGSLPDSVNYDLDPFWGFTIDTLYWRDLWTLNSEWAAQFSAEYSRFELDSDSKFVNLFTGFSAGYKYARSSRQSLRTVWTRTTASPHQWTFGASFDSFDALPKTQDLPIPFNPDGPAAGQPLFHPGSNGALPIDIFELNYQNYGAFAQLKSRWNERSATTLVLRYDDNSRYDSVVNARLSWTYKATRDVTFKAMAGSAYLAPSPELAYEHFGSFAFQRNDGIYESFFFQVPNPDLQPEKLRSVELGLDWQLTPSTLVSLQLYHNQLDDLILFAPTSVPESGFVPGGHIQFTTHNANVGRVETTGLSVSLRRLQQVGSGTLDWWLAADWIDGSLNSPQGESDAPYSADAMLKLGLAYRHSDWTEYLRCEGVKSPHGDGINEVNRAGKGHLVCDLAVGFQAGQRDQWRLEVHNMSDARYYATGEGGTTVFFNVPQPGRWLELSWQHNF
jgi:outer membrane receptor protein involved in Fe transport